MSLDGTLDLTRPNKLIKATLENDHGYLSLRVVNGQIMLTAEKSR